MSDTPLFFFGIIDPTLMAAGCLGGLVHAWRVEKATPWEVIGYIVIGGIAANFFAPLATSLIGIAIGFLPPEMVLALIPPKLIAFGLGLSGKHLCFAFEVGFNRIGDLWKAKNE